MVKTRKQKAFTLIELLVVIAIIALLLAVVIPSLRMAKEYAKRLICATHLRAIGQAIVLYADQQDNELPMNFYQQDPGNTGLDNRRDYATPMAAYFLGDYDASVHNGSPSDRMSSMCGKNANGDERVTNLGYLISTGLLDDAAEVLYCSSNKTELYSYDAYGSDSAWPKGLGDAVEYNPYSIRVSYSYLPQAIKSKHPDPAMSAFPDAAYKMTRLNPNLSIAMDLLNGTDEYGEKQMSHYVGSNFGANILYGAGYVMFRKDKDNVIDPDENLIDIEKAVEWRSAMRALE